MEYNAPYRAHCRTTCFIISIISNCLTIIVSAIPLYLATRLDLFVFVVFQSYFLFSLLRFGDRTGSLTTLQSVRAALLSGRAKERIRTGLAEIKREVRTENDKTKRENIKESSIKLLFSVQVRKFYRVRKTFCLYHTKYVKKILFKNNRIRLFAVEYLYLYENTRTKILVVIRVCSYSYKNIACSRTKILVQK